MTFQQHASAPDSDPGVPSGSPELDRIENGARAITDAHGAVEVAGQLAQALAEVLPDTEGEVWLRGADDEQWVDAAVWPPAPGDTPIDTAARRARSQFTRRTLPEDSTVDLPLTRDGQPLAVVRLRSVEYATQHLCATALQAARILCTTATAALAGQALQNRLRQRNVRDPMTGLFNARYLEDTLQRELLRARRAGVTLILVRLDVDDYPYLLERYGRDAAQTLIQDLAGVLQDSFRGSDVWCRTGDASFAVLLPEAELDGGTERAKRVRDAMAARTPRFAGEALGPVRVSAGIAAYPTHGDSVDLLNEAAEGAVQLARDAGGDTVRIAERVGPDV